MVNMNILLCSSKFVDGDIAGNAKKIIDLLEMNSKKDIEFVFLGEAFLNGFDSLKWDYSMDLLMKNDTLKYVELISEKCNEYNTGVGFGYFEFDKDNIYSSYIVFDSNGNEVSNYRRISKGWRFPNVDSNIYKEGNQIAKFVYRNVTFGLGLCGDVWDDRLYNKYIEQSFDVFLWPVYVSYDKAQWYRNERENYIHRSSKLAKYVLYVNSVSDVPSFGGSYLQLDRKLIEEKPLSGEETSLKVIIE